MFVSEPLRLMELTLPTAVENVTLDEVLLRTVDAARGTGSPFDGSLLRLWEPADYCVVLGRANRVERNVRRDRCERDGVPIVRRCTGGGTVLLGPGALVFTLVLRLDSSESLARIEAATALILDRLLGPLRRHVTDLVRRGTSDLAAGEVKVSGNAQRRLRHTVLHHGTLLYNFDLEKMGEYLTAPERQPDYRQGRGHREFVQNLPVGAAELRRLLIESWNATLPPPPIPREELEKLIPQRSTDEWTFRL